MLRWTLIAIAALGLISCSADEPQLQIKEARVLINPVAGRPAGGYFIIENKGGADELLAVESPQAGRIEIHTHAQEDGVMRMMRLDSLAIPSHESVQFERGGLHLMVFEIEPGLEPGGEITLRFEFGTSGMIEAQARLEGFGG